MRAFTWITVVVNIVYVLITLIFHRRGRIYFMDIASVAFWAGQEYVYLAALKSFAKPVLNSEGMLQSCPDVSSPSELGMYNLAQDGLWICWVVQVLCSIHHAFIVFYLPLPATFIYKIYVLARPFLPFGSKKNGEEDGEGAGQEAPTNRKERRQEALNRRKGRN